MDALPPDYHLLSKPVFPPPFTNSRGLGPSYDSRHFALTANNLVVVHTAGIYRIMTCGDPAAVLFESDDLDTINWLDFTLELIVGLIGLALGLTIGRKGYKALKPLITRLWAYPEVQGRIRAIGQLTLQRDALATGWALAELWGHLWTHHRRDLVAGIWGAVRQEFTAGALLITLLRWTARLMSGGITFLFEVGVMAIPLGGKLLR